MARKGIMLCYPLEEKRFNKWGNMGIMGRKLNGERCRVIINNDRKVTMKSSEDNTIPYMTHIAESVIKMGLKNIELDGELYLHGMPRQKIHSIVSRKVNKHPESELIEFHCFDIINQYNQTERLQQLIKLPFNNVIKLVQPQIVTSMKEIEYYLNEYIEEGYEGFVLKNMNALYKRKRATSWMKFKPKYKDEYTIIGSEEERDLSGKLKGTLGALIVQKDNTIFNVGTGFKRKQRELLWEMRETLPGKICVVGYHELTLDGKPVPGVFVDIKEAL